MPWQHKLTQLWLNHKSQSCFRKDKAFRNAFTSCLICLWITRVFTSNYNTMEKQCNIMVYPVYFITPMEHTQTIKVFFYISLGCWKMCRKSAAYAEWATLQRSWMLQRFPLLLLWLVHTKIPIPVCRYMDQKGSAAMLTSLQSTGVTPEVNLRITQARKHAKALKLRADITRSPKQGHQTGSGSTILRLLPVLDLISKLYCTLMTFAWIPYHPGESSENTSIF